MFRDRLGQLADKLITTGWLLLLVLAFLFVVAAMGR
jgi:hypothetical protein